MDKEKYQNQSTGDSKPQETKKYGDYSIEELENMAPEQEADLEAEAVMEALNDRKNHGKTK